MRIHGSYPVSRILANSVEHASAQIVPFSSFAPRIPDIDQRPYVCVIPAFDLPESMKVDCLSGDEVRWQYKDPNNLIAQTELFNSISGFSFIDNLVAEVLLNHTMPIGNGFGRILEVGPGGGRFTRSIPSDYRDKWAVLEINQFLIPILQRQCSRVFQGSIYSPPEHIGTYDGIVGLNSMDSPALQELALKKVFSLLRKGGRALFIQDILPALEQSLPAVRSSGELALCLALKEEVTRQEMIRLLETDFYRVLNDNNFGHENFYFSDRSGKKLHQCSEYHERLVWLMRKVGFRVGDDSHGTFRFRMRMRGEGDCGILFKFGRGYTGVLIDPNIPAGFSDIEYTAEVVVGVKD